MIKIFKKKLDALIRKIFKIKSPSEVYTNPSNFEMVGVDLE